MNASRPGSSAPGYTLAIGAGNSNTVFAIYAGDTYLGKWRLETRAGRSADEYGAWLLTIFQHVEIDPSYINGVIFCCVVPAVEPVIISMCRRFFKVEPVVVVPGIKTGVQINYGRAGDLGPDRVANVVAASHIYKQNAIVVDFGTTTAIDIIDAKGQYAGGLIAPGVSLALSALSRAAPQLPDVSLQKPESIVGRHLAHSMQAGCFWGVVEMVEGLIRRIENEMSLEKPAVILTGGFAKDMSEGMKRVDFIDINLTLTGLKLIYDLNMERPLHAPRQSNA